MKKGILKGVRHAIQAEDASPSPDLLPYYPRPRSSFTCLPIFLTLPERSRVDVFVGVNR